MGNLKVEYLIIVSAKNSFCASKQSLSNLLMSNDDILINNDELKYKELEVQYQVQTKQLETNSERYFHITFVCRDDKKINEFENLLRDVKDILYKISPPQKIWDDVSFYYAKKSYPLIYEVENLMRKLITKFMLANVGLGWSKDNIPDEVKNSIKSSDSKEKKDIEPDYLYKTDFIQLANFLFKLYTPHSVSSLYSKIREISEITELSLAELKSFVPRSNWERYFLTIIVECDDNYLNKRWKDLYELRCKVAHNNSLNKNEYRQILQLSNEVKVVLEKAIESLDKIHVLESDKEVVAENIAGNNDLYFNFIKVFKKLESILYKKASILLGENDSDNRGPSYVNNLLRKSNIITVDYYLKIEKFIEQRNIIVHSPNVEYSKEQIEALAEELLQVINDLKSMQEPILNDWSVQLKNELQASYMQDLMSQLELQTSTKTTYPSIADVFNALHFSSFEQTKVVILGHSPYHGPGQADGLSFSVEIGNAIPPSLRNIFKELKDDVGCEIPNHGKLEEWAKQGVLLLNSVLTVEEGAPNSHSGLGWDRFTNSIIDALNQRERPVVFILWGSHAQSKIAQINKDKHFIITSVHPSPLSAMRGFFGSKPFSRTNEYLKQIGSQPINWCLNPNNGT